MIKGETVVCINNKTTILVIYDDKEVEKNTTYPLKIGERYIIEDIANNLRGDVVYRVRNKFNKLKYYNYKYFSSIEEYRDEQLNKLDI